MRGSTSTASFFVLSFAGFLAACSSGSTPPTDGGAHDGSSGDASHADAATDGGHPDAAMDAAAHDDASTGDDASTSDDASTGDASTGDASTGDASSGDASSGDASSSDASTTDASTGDASVADAGSPDLGPGGCLTITDCAGPMDYCMTPTGMCGGVGTCTMRSGICPFIVAPVCGCDGTTYTNACLAGRAGQPIAHTGMCTPVGITCCSGARDCGAGQECAQTTTTATVMGICKTLPSDGGCWTDDDCVGPGGSHGTCVGASVCGCSTVCIEPDAEGTCS